MKIEPCKKLIRDLDLNPGDEYTQDWTCEAADYRKLEMFLSYFEEIFLKSEEKRALIELILDSYESYVKIFDFNLKYSKKIKQILKKEYDLFKDIIQYWSCEGEELENSFLITPLVRSVME